MNKIMHPERTSWKTLLERPSRTFDSIETLVNSVFQEVRLEGDEAVKRYTEKFDGIALSDISVCQTEIEAAISQVPEALKSSIRSAKENIEKFHKAQRTEKIEIETTDGVRCWQEKRPIQKVGLYIPGGTAPLFSTILMLAVPAVIAGCKQIVLCTPPDKQGKIHPAIAYTAQLCGIKEIYKVGGIQAIAALTYGTTTVPAVYKIFGPGNQYFTVAKQIATKHGVAIDMPAGPSELLVVADETANPAFVASDLLSQAEHGTDSQVILVTTSKELMQQVEEEVALQLEALPRKDIAREAINNSKLIFLENDQQAIELINEYAPEHFIICCRNEAYYLEHICNAGSVFIGNYTPESAGDYASGTNHTLPTNGYAKQYSGVNLDSFTKSITFQKISEAGLKNIGPTIEIMAEAEGLRAHKNAVAIRLKSLK
ncbi:MAG: histidinol dehydrogenase [Eudoraea sp.]|nr:histidinol dehydrogenase [Eudoraea sp.]